MWWISKQENMFSLFLNMAVVNMTKYYILACYDLFQCSVTCGSGVRNREFQCSRRDTQTGKYQAVSPDRCQRVPRPSVILQETCTKMVCKTSKSRWFVSPWGKVRLSKSINSWSKFNIFYCMEIIVLSIMCIVAWETIICILSNLMFLWLNPDILSYQPLTCDYGLTLICWVTTPWVVIMT